jgi:hypothetical protein
MVEMRNSHGILVGEFERKNFLGSFRCRWRDNIRMDIKKREDVVWVYMAEDEDLWWCRVNMLMNVLNFTKGGKFLE